MSGSWSAGHVDDLPFPTQDPGPVDTASSRWRLLAAGLGDLADRVTGDRAPLAGAWSGTAADACDAELAAVAALARRVAGALHAAAGSLTTYAVELDGARHAVALLRTEIAAQLDTFTQALGRAPAYIDGHQHVHQLPVVRTLLLEEIARRYPAAALWLRSTQSPPPAKPAPLNCEM